MMAMAIDRFQNRRRSDDRERVLKVLSMYSPYFSICLLNQYVLFLI